MPTDPAAASNNTNQDSLERMAALKDRGKAPASARVLNRWVAQAQDATGLEAQRLSWLVATTVVVAALQRAVDEDGRSRFLLKGGTYLQYRLNWSGRPTKDVDGLVRGDIDHFLDALDDSLRPPWGPLELSRTAVEVINTPGKVIKPRRLFVLVSLRGEVWRRVKVEISPDEADAAAGHEVLAAPDLKHFGIPSPDHLVGIAMRFQVAQKLHASTDPHAPPDQVNDRARDVVDLLLLRELVEAEGTPSLAELHEACAAVFDARSTEARQLGRPARDWPPTLVAHPHWDNDYEHAAAGAGVSLPVAEAVSSINEWIRVIAAAPITR